MKQINKYRSSEMLYSNLKDSVVLPNFQRRLVWSKQQKEAFIETLHNGYPFGSILIYRYNDNGTEKNKFSLIDGLQRYTTIKDFQESPENYIKFTNIINDIMSTISKDYDGTVTVSTEIKCKDTIRKSISDIIKNEKLKEPYALVDLLKKDGLSGLYKEKFDRSIIEIQPKITEQINDHIDVDTITIPCIEFTGDENELATVFENLNRGGKKLSKYQVFAAQWSIHDIQLSSQPNSSKILEKVISRYERLIEEREIEIENYDSEDMKLSKRINLSELCCAIGELILETMPVFWDSTAVESEDKANAIGYSTVAVTLGISNKKLDTISNHIELFNTNEFLEDFIQKIINEYSTINNYFEKYLSQPGISPQKKYESKLTPDFQLLSFFASLWSVKYEINTTKKVIETTPHYKNHYQTTLNNFIYHYIEDILTKRWSGTGDSKLDDIYIDKNYRYLKPLAKDTLEETLRKFWDEKSSVSSIRFEPISKMLITVQSSFYKDQFKAISYDFEHVISKKSIATIYKQDNIPAGSLGNIMYLDSSYNRSKRDLNLYSSLHEGQKLDDNFLENSLYPGKNLLEEIEKDLVSNKKDSHRVIDLITIRGKNILNNLIENLYR